MQYIRDRVFPKLGNETVTGKLELSKLVEPMNITVNGRDYSTSH